MFFDLFVTSAAPFSALPEPELSEEDERALTAGVLRPLARGLQDEGYYPWGACGNLGPADEPVPPARILET
jgi:hypothetical protein